MQANKKQTLRLTKVIVGIPPENNYWRLRTTVIGRLLFLRKIKENNKKYVQNVLSATNGEIISPEKRSLAIYQGNLPWWFWHGIKDPRGMMVLD